MNYLKIYNSLISKAQTRGWIKSDNTLENPIEIHHIVPKSMGGSDEPSNLVGLTLREHVIAHILLAKAHGGLYWRAAYGMMFGNRLNEISTRTIETLMRESRKLISASMIGNTNGSYEWSDERLEIHRLAMSKVAFTDAKRSALMKAWNRNRGSVQSKESNEKRSKRMKEIGFVPTKAGDFETCSRAGKANKGKTKPPRSDEHKLNLSKRKSAKPVIIDGIEYHGIKYAARQLNMDPGTLRGRINNPRFTNYMFKEQHND